MVKWGFDERLHIERKCQKSTIIVFIFYVLMIKLYIIIILYKLLEVAPAFSIVWFQEISITPPPPSPVEGDWKFQYKVSIAKCNVSKEK